MDIFEKLPREDVELVRGYINTYGGSDEGSSHMESGDMGYFLRYWNANKAPFYKMFGEKFILKRDICFEMDPELMEEDMDNTIRYGDSLVWDFKQRFEAWVDNHLYDLDYDYRYSLKRFVNDIAMLVKNEYDGEAFCIPGYLTVDKRPLQINHGVKAVKMLGKICKAIGFELTRYKCPLCGRYSTQPLGSYECCCHHNADPINEKVDGYETFRRAHSLVLNQKKLRGNLCLSIHPLDYITMSDNECGWQSCMQWMEEAGDYRLGTIEMMNSPYCVVAYVEAKNPMSLWNSETTWNNKRWRQLLMITPEMLLGNKQYPYFSDNLQGTAMKWLRELANAGDFRCAENNKRFGPYEEEALQIGNQRWNKVGIKEVYVHFWFDYMYCDIYDHRLAFIASNMSGDRIEYNLSGPAICTNCGAVIEKTYENEVEPSWTTCRECNGMWKCVVCGDWHYGEPYYAEDSDDPMCSDCYEHETEECEVCGERVREIDTVFLRLISDNTDPDIECFNWSFTIDFCHHCRDSQEFKELFGEVHQCKDMYGRMRGVVFLDEVSDEGLDRGSIYQTDRIALRLVRDAKSIEEKVKLVQHHFY